MFDVSAFISVVCLVFNSILLRLTQTSETQKNGPDILPKSFLKVVPESQYYFNFATHRRMPQLYWHIYFFRYYWEQMLESVLAIHDEHIVHSDLKPNNFVLVRGHLKVIDLGLSVELRPGQQFVRRDFLGGTRDYMSPESLQCYVIEDGAIDVQAMRDNKVAGIMVGYKSDVWSLGVILYQLSYGGVVPFSRVPGGRLGKLKAVISPQIPVDFEPLSDPLLMDVLQQALRKDPHQRANVQQLLQHQFLRPNNSLS